MCTAEAVVRRRRPPDDDAHRSSSSSSSSRRSQATQGMQHPVSAGEPRPLAAALLVGCYWD